MASTNLSFGSFFIFLGLLTQIECSIQVNCSENIIKKCRDRFDENTNLVCSEIQELNECLITQTDCDKSKDAGLQFIYRHLRYKVHLNKHCIKEIEGKNVCNESQARICYNQYDSNATQICKTVKELNKCINRLQGCHEMKHPSYTLSLSVLHKHRRCFYVNYSRILEVLDKKSGHKIKVQSTNTSASTVDETSTDFLPYTFVVVATVCTCLFLVILVVFSVVRHTSLVRRQRHSTIERPPIGLVVSPCRPSSQRTRRHFRRSGRRSRRRHMYVIHEARQTVSGFFEGNVPPPPYSAVLDDTESLRAGDRPPPYQPPSYISIGVIV